jgi:hypothetical protein
VFATVLTPLALAIADLPRLARIAILAGALAAATMWMTPGILSAALVAPYAIVGALAALEGARRLFAAPWPPARHVALIVLAAAMAWLVAYRAGYALLGYPPLWVLLTAAHFHVAGCYLPLVVASVARTRRAHAIALGCIAGLPLTAIGILVTGPFETFAAMTMAVSAFAAAIYLLVTQRGLLRLAGIPLAAGMLLAMAYALRLAPMLGSLDPLSTMIATHAILDTAFATLALVALFRSRT